MTYACFFFLFDARPEPTITYSHYVTLNAIYINGPGRQGTHIRTTMSLSESTAVPGLQPGLKVHVSGGGENTEWLNFETKKKYTNAFIICGAKVF
jgi:hypothetical protein